LSLIISIQQCFEKQAFQNGVRDKVTAFCEFVTKPKKQKMKTVKTILPIFTLLFVLTSCGDLEKKIEEKLNIITDKALRLDSLVNKELDKVNSLDSIINLETEKVKVLDSLVNKSSSRMDSLVNGKIDKINKIFN